MSSFCNEKINVAFFGSSDFSVPTLKFLLNDEDIDVKNIITLPPAEKNRGKKMSNNVIYDFAINNGFSPDKIMTPKTLKNNYDLLYTLKQQNLDFIVVVAYGKIITKEIIDLPKFEILNLHPSSLPKYRGAAPIERAIEAGESDIDICIMKVDVGLDTGDIAIRRRYVFGKDKTARDIIPDIANIGGELMLDVIKKSKKSEIKFTKQNGEYTYANKIDKSELLIDLSNKDIDAEHVFNKIRAFNNCGCCYFVFNNQRVKIISCDMEKCSNSVYGFDRKSGFIFFKNGTIKPILVQKEGKKPMQLKDYLNGLK